jgi:branched-chain amino acid transport system substrate-binding protein
MKFKRIVGLLSAAAMSVVLAGGASAQGTVKIGAIYPLSGNAASTGVHTKAAFETAVEIINNGNPALGNLPLTRNAGLKGLGGAKVEVIFADNQGSRRRTKPGASPDHRRRWCAFRLLSVRHYADDERDLGKYGIPFLNGESVAANLTERGFKWFFGPRR